jgi:LuxR family transcriptional regulator, activator of conjugal transfer of Ti plasmids
MERDVQAFIARVRAAAGVDELAGLLAHELARHGFGWFAYAAAPLLGAGASAPAAFTTYPEDWVRHYVARRHYRRDPAVAAGRATTLPFAWSELSAAAKASPVMLEAREAGLINGISVPIHGPGGQFALLSAATSLPDGKFAAALHRLRHPIHVMALHYHAALAERVGTRGPATALTGREYDVLLRLVHGSSRREISAALGIAERTVAAHIGNAKRKLGVRSASQAAAKAARRHLIAP